MCKNELAPKKKFSSQGEKKRKVLVKIATHQTSPDSLFLGGLEGKVLNVFLSKNNLKNVAAC